MILGYSKKTGPRPELHAAAAIADLKYIDNMK